MQGTFDQTAEARKRLQSAFRFVQALHNRRNPPQRQIESQPWHYWVGDLPDHPSIDLRTVLEDRDREPPAGEENGSAEAAVLIRVRRPELTAPPAPPADLLPWLVRGWDDPTRAVERRTALNVERDGVTQVVRFDEDPNRVQEFEAWCIEHADWAAAETPARAALRCFERFYELHAQIERDSESLELLLGDGLLNWNLQAGRVRHPLLLQRVDLRFDPKIAEFSILDTDSPPELYSPLLQSIGEVDGVALRAIRQELSSGGYHPLGGPATGGFLRGLITRLAARGTFVEDGSPDLGDADAPSLRRAPILFLRSRSLGFATCIQEVIDDLGAEKPIPRSLVRVVGIEPASSSPQGDGPAGQQALPPRAPAEDQILFSLPANPEQLRIAQRLEGDGGVLVQGPPGTGKTHTIANLLGHLGCVPFLVDFGVASEPTS
jgi:hypothetical protein